MLDEKGVQTLFTDIHNRWVEPELSRRQKEGTLPDNFKIRRCLIKLPKQADPIVQFNGEISWVVRIKMPAGVAFKAGDPVYFSQVEYVETVEPPMHDGVPVAFFYVYWTGVSWRIVFDGAPNDLHRESQPTAEDWYLGSAIAESINLILREYAVLNHDGMQADIQAIGLWVVPALLPYPLTKIVELCRSGDQGGARRTLVEYCHVDFLRELVRGWTAVPAFAVRSQLFSDALTAHAAQQYTLSISALLPHLEGVITDWAYAHISPSDVPFRQESKTKKFRDVLAKGVDRTFTDQRVAESVVDFIVDGPVLDTFTDWLRPVPDSFPNRNVVGHGKYDLSVYTVENSIKVFLVLDTLYRIMADHRATNSSATSKSAI